MSYHPKRLPLDSLDIGQFAFPLGEAREKLGRYDSLLSSFSNSQILASPLLDEEAALSSKIKGTQATFDEVLQHRGGIIIYAKRDEIKEIENYREALSDGHKSLKTGYKISMPIVRELHKTLLKNVRGKDKFPGKVRLTQNFIGEEGATNINNATFVPPSPEHLTSCLENWVSYLTKNDEEPLIQTALMHAQFELLHPFCDGNGRLGRILIPLLLYQKNIISEPTFYISAYLESNRDIYNKKLDNISKQGDWAGWVFFFLKATTAQAETNIEKIHKITALQDEMQREIQEITRSRYTLNILNTIFANPYCNTANFIANDIPAPSVYHLVKKLEHHKILTQLDLGRRKKIYVFKHLLDIILK